jgi:hypothetical protein
VAPATTKPARALFKTLGGEMMTMAMVVVTDTVKREILHEMTRWQDPISSTPSSSSSESLFVYLEHLICFRFLAMVRSDYTRLQLASFVTKLVMRPEEFIITSERPVL